MALGSVALGYAEPTRHARGRRRRRATAMSPASRDVPRGRGGRAAVRGHSVRRAGAVPQERRRGDRRGGAHRAHVHRTRSSSIGCGYFGWHDWSSTMRPAFRRRRALLSPRAVRRHHRARGSGVATRATLAAIVIEPVIERLPSTRVDHARARAVRRGRRGADLRRDEDGLSAADRRLSGISPGSCPISRRSARRWRTAIRWAAVVGTRDVDGRGANTWISSTLAAESTALAAASAVLDWHEKADVCEVARGPSAPRCAGRCGGDRGERRSTASPSRASTRCGCSIRRRRRASALRRARGGAGRALQARRVQLRRARARRDSDRRDRGARERGVRRAARGASGPRRDRESPGAARRRAPLDRRARALLSCRSGAPTGSGERRAPSRGRAHRHHVSRRLDPRQLRLLVAHLFPVAGRRHRRQRRHARACAREPDRIRCYVDGEPERHRARARARSSAASSAARSASSCSRAAAPTIRCSIRSPKTRAKRGLAGAAPHLAAPHARVAVAGDLRRRRPRPPRRAASDARRSFSRTSAAAATGRTRSPRCATAPNILPDLSGSGVDRGMLDAALAVLGADRLLWGCDITMETGLAKLRALDVIGLERRRARGHSLAECGAHLSRRNAFRARARRRQRRGTFGDDRRQLAHRPVSVPPPAASRSDVLVRVLEREGLDGRVGRSSPVRVSSRSDARQRGAVRGAAPHRRALEPVPAIRPDWPDWERALDAGRRGRRAGGSRVSVAVGHGPARSEPCASSRSPPESEDGRRAHRALRGSAPAALTRHRGRSEAAAIRRLASAGDGVRLVVTAAGRDMIEEVHWGLTPTSSGGSSGTSRGFGDRPRTISRKLFRTIGASDLCSERSGRFGSRRHRARTWICSPTSSCATRGRRVDLRRDDERRCRQTVAERTFDRSIRITHVGTTSASLARDIESQSDFSASTDAPCEFVHKSALADIDTPSPHRDDQAKEVDRHSRALVSWPPAPSCSPRTAAPPPRKTARPFNRSTFRTRSTCRRSG